MNPIYHVIMCTANGGERENKQKTKPTKSNKHKTATNQNQPINQKHVLVWSVEYIQKVPFLIIYLLMGKSCYLKKRIQNTMKNRTSVFFPQVINSCQPGGCRGCKREHLKLH